MAENIFYDLSTNKAFRDDKSEIANLNLPENIYKTTSVFNLQLMNSQDLTAGEYADFYTGFVGISVTSRAAVDNNYIHTSTALLSTALPVGVPAANMIIKTVGTNFNSTRPAGTINIGAESVNYNAITDNGDDTYTLQMADGSFATQDFTPAATYAINTALVTVEIALIVDSAVDVTYKDTGLLVITNDAFNSVYQAEANGLEEIENCFQEFSVIQSGTTIMRKRFAVGCLGALDDDGESAPAPTGGYYNKTESDSRYVRQALTTAYSATVTPAGTDKLFVRQSSTSKYLTLAQIATFASDTGTEVNCPDDAPTPITLGAVATYRMAKIIFTIDDGTNYIKYEYNVGHDDPTVTDDGGDAFIITGVEISGVAITFDISGGNLRMVITLTGVGNAVKCVYKISDLLIIST